MASTRYCSKNNILIVTFLILSCQNWYSEAAGRSLLHAEVTNACRSIISTFETMGELIVNGDKDLSVICNSPGGKNTIILPVNKTAADQLISLKILDPEAPTVVTIHGFNDHPGKPIPLGITNGYFALGQHNVLQIDSSRVTSTDFFKSIRVSWLMSEVIAKFLGYLYSAGVISPSKTHLIGMSLGGHSAGGVGRIFKKLTGHKIARITGLEQPTLCFEYNKKQLTKKDAEYVDIIHSNRGFGGIYETVGHSDYFVNGGGPNQPGCEDIVCNHLRAGQVFIESLNPNYETFYARKCDSFFKFMGGICDENEISIMGYNSSTKSRGLYYLRTKNEPPYSMGMEGTKSSDNQFFYGILGRLGIKY